MHARDTRAGGRHLASERGATADRPLVIEFEPASIPAGRIADRLDINSLTSVACYLEVTLIQVAERYDIKF